MTEPDPVEPPVEPEYTLAELDALISKAGQELTAALLARPRNQARIDTARAELLRLRALRDAQAG